MLIKWGRGGPTSMLGMHTKVQQALSHSTRSVEL